MAIQKPKVFQTTSRLGTNSDMSSRNTSGIMRSKWAPVTTSPASEALEDTKMTGTDQQMKYSTTRFESSPQSPRSPETTHSVKRPTLASEAEFFALSPLRGNGSAKKPLPTEPVSKKTERVAVPTKSPFLVLAPDQAPSVSFWVPKLYKSAITEREQASIDKTEFIHEPTPTSRTFADIGTATDREVTPWKPTACFRDLPASVLECIFQQLRTKSDQRALTLASSRGCVYLLRRLYAETRICLDADPENLKAVLHMTHSANNGVPFNQGLKYIRHLEFFTRGGAVQQDPCQLARHVIVALHDTPLERFTWPSHIPLDADIMWRLWKPLNPPMETMLSTLHLNEELWSASHDKTTKDALMHILPSSGRHLKHVEISAESKVGLQSISVLLKKMEQYNGPLISFSLDLHELDPPMGPGRVKWDGTVDEPIFDLLFKHLPPLRTLRSPQYKSITKIVLSSVNLFQARTTLCNVVSLRNLKHLELLRCPFAGVLLDTTTRAACIGLRTLKVDHDVDDSARFHGSDPEDPSEISNAVYACFKSFAFCLRKLHVRVKGHSHLALDKEQLHCPNLQSLYIDVAEEASGLESHTTNQTQNPILIGSLLQTSVFDGGSDLTCEEIAVASAGRAWVNGTQVRQVFLDRGVFQQEILKYASPKILTIFMSQWTLSLLYDNPTQRLKAAKDEAANEVMEGTFAVRIATRAFEIAANIDPESFTPDVYSSPWVRADAVDAQQPASLKVVVLAVEPDELPTRSTNGVAANGGTGQGSRYASGASASKAHQNGKSAPTARAKQARRYCFVRGHETAIVDGVAVKRESTIPVTVRELERMGVDIPKYFE